MNNPGLSDPPFPRLGPAPTRSGGYPEPASLAPPPPLRGASRRGRNCDVNFEAQEATAYRSRLAGYPTEGWVWPGGVGAPQGALNCAADLWDRTLGRDAIELGRVLSPVERGDRRS
jgi:hypothetical protein